MNEFLKMDIFFFVATIAIMALTTLVVLALMRVLNILHHVERISKHVSEESALVREDVKGARIALRTQGLKLGHFLHSAGGIFRRSSRKKSHT